ncbi:TLR4 interactor with leucine rich repeats [Pangasianodon hypophthalmus]|uniref:TLR4 interactor with leucine rich repeats n=1 Tax=Pangasianodon hypophthalmus TaxID=310915 RepID=UPI002307923C|nr:TLR4 interactor with leucine rich repeats [Pangasianodon hypophthalmus]
MAKRALSHLALWNAGALSLLLLCARAACPELCECPRAQHVLCANRGLHAVPESSRSVRVLGLAGNFIGNVSALALAHYGHLTRLDLQFNQIRRVHPKAFEKLVELEELYLGHNLISTLHPGTFGPLQKLTVLYGNDNDIRDLTGDTFGRLERLVRLRLDKNAIERLSESVFKHLSSLMFLQLESNQLRHIHHKAFSTLTKLQFLNLSDNKQTQLRATALFSQLRSLVTLLLSGNQITHIGSHVFQNLKKLTKLSLSNNHILRLENDTLKGLARLRELAIDGNELTEIQAGVLEPLARVERLDLSDNRITRIDPAAFTRLARLRVLDLSNNRLRRISGGAFASNAALLQLDLSGNEWKCDCRLEKLKEWMAETRARGKLLTALVRCHHPPTLEGKYLDHVNDTELLADRTGSGYCKPDDEAEVMEARGAGAQEPPGVTEERLNRGGGKEEDMAADGGHRNPTMKRKKEEKLRTKPAPSASAKASSSSALLGTRTTKMFPLMLENASMWELNDAVRNPGSHKSEPQKRVEHYAARRVELTDACHFNRRYIENVSVHNVSFDSSTVSWSTPEDTHTVRGQALMFRVLFDRFGHSARFPRYVYTDGSARAVTLQELRPDSTYITCVESVVGGALCQVAPRDHCAGFVTTSPSAESDVKLQHVTAAVLAANALLILLVGGVWLGRVLKRRIKTRKSSTHTHVRHMYSTRRPFRSAMATTCVSSEFSGYQSGRPLAEEGDLIQFPVDRFFDSSCTRRDDDSVIPRLSD